MGTLESTLLLLVAAVIAGLLWFSLPRLVGESSGRLLLLVVLFVMPVLLLLGGATKSLTGSKQRDFCVSCHEMEVYDTSMYIDDPEYLPAVHFQNRYVSRDTACYTCHTDYTLYGDFTAKLAGLKHVWVHYLGDVPEAGEFKLYEPYPNANCLQCHQGARRFERQREHNSEEVTLEMLYEDQKSCISGGCHDKIHDISNLGHLDLWGTPQFAVPDALKNRPSPGGADDPFADDPFADEKDLWGDDDEPTAPAADRPASEIENVDDLWDDEEPGEGQKRIEEQEEPGGAAPDAPAGDAPARAEEGR